MSDGLEHMDDAFKRMSEEMNFSYDKSLWDQMSADLNDAAMDDAFVNAAENVSVSAAGASFLDVEDTFMDDAFQNASANSEAAYSSSLWTNFVANEADIYMDEAFVNAANAAKAEYSPVYWGMANAALTSEGLHHEYKPAYWEEALSMLEESDRKGFFFRWSAVAAILLLISFLGMNSSIFNDASIVDAQINQSGDEVINKSTSQLSTLMTRPDVLNAQALNIIEENPAFNQDAIENDIVENNNFSNEIENNSLDNINNVEGNDVVENRSNENPTSNNAEGGDVENELPQNEELDENSTMNPNEGVNPELVDGSMANTVNEETVDANDQNELNDENTSQDSDGTDLSPEYEMTSIPNELAVVNPAKEIADFEMTKISFDNDLDISNKWLAPEIEIIKGRITPSHYLTLNFQTGYGIQYGLGYIPPSMRNTVGISWATTYGRLKRFEFGVGLSATRNIQNNLGIEERVTIYDVHGGATRSWMKYQIKDAYYTGLDLNLSYNFNLRHKIMTSVSGSYLTAVRSNMSYQINADEITTVNDNWGVLEGLNKTDVLLGLGYQYYIGKGFSFSVKGQLGLFDRTENEFLGESLFDHETNLQLGLHYNIFTKH